MPDATEKRAVIFYFSCIPYSFLFQRPQQLFTQWRSNFNDLYEFYYVDAPIFSVFMRYAGLALRRSTSKSLFKKTIQDDSHILRGLIQPPRGIRGRRFPRWIYENFFASQLCRTYIRKILAQQCCGTQKRVAIVASPFWEPFISKNDFDLICYDYLDDIEISTGGSANFYDLDVMKKRHQRLAEASDVIFVTAEKLKHDTARIVRDKEIVMVSNAVDSEFFDKKKGSYQITDYVKGNDNTVGYVGVLSVWTDLDLIYSVAQKLSDVDFVLIGPFDPEAKTYIKNKPANVFTLGIKDHTQVPAYVDIFDVCTIPFKPGPISDSTDPVKLYEYFSLGKPVVATPLKALERYNDGRLLKIARTADEFARAVNFFLLHDSPESQAARRQIARENSWQSKATSIMETIERRLKE